MDLQEAWIRGKSISEVARMQAGERKMVCRLLRADSDGRGVARWLQGTTWTVAPRAPPGTMDDWLLSDLREVCSQPCAPTWHYTSPSTSGGRAARCRHSSRSCRGGGPFYSGVEEILARLGDRLVEVDREVELIPGIPGLIDTHFHTGQQLLRGKVIQTCPTAAAPASDFEKLPDSLESVLSPDDVHLSAQVAYARVFLLGAATL